MLVVAVICLGLLHVTSATNILFLNTWNSKSHALTMKPLAERYAFQKLIFSTLQLYYNVRLHIVHRHT
ncbi:hypothetical protein GCK32_022198 [Trichostrongylus colubriformis]|uniref:Secreted protein n=1 Tax=Trichostrongylus colubriformis TaxID=6319 RepID=A0AAN8G2V0_TRICO